MEQGKCLVKYSQKRLSIIKQEKDLKNTAEHFKSLQKRPVKKDAKNILGDSFNQGYYKRFFIEIKKLGRGNRGSVFLCQHVLNGTKLGLYAIKKIAVGDDKERLKTLLKEVLSLEKLSDKNVVDYKHSWIELHRPAEFGPVIPCLFVLMEVANGGNLEELIEGGIQLTSDEILDITEQTLTGLLCLHVNGLVHRDIKPANILLHFEAGTSSPRVIIADFDTCQENSFAGMEFGTVDFCSPEVVDVLERKEKKLSAEILRKSDLWSVGMVLYYLNHHTLPYQNTDNIDLLKAEIINLNSISFEEGNIHNGLLCVLHALLKIDYKERPSTQQALKLVRNIQKSFSMHKKENLVCYKNTFYVLSLFWWIVFIKGAFFLIYQKTLLELYIFVLSSSVDYLIYSRAKKRKLLLSGLSLVLYVFHCWF